MDRLKLALTEDGEESPSSSNFVLPPRQPSEDTTANNNSTANPDSPEAAPSASTNLCAIQWVVVEDIGRRGISVFSRQSIRMALHIAGCKAQQSVGSVVRLIEALAAAGNHLGIYQSSRSGTLFEQWRVLRCGDTCHELAADASAPLFVLVSRAQLSQQITLLLKQELRGEYVSEDPLRRFQIAASIVERKRPFVVLCGGTSGCGKSTLAGLVASRIGISTVISTDTIREILRMKTDPAACPPLFLSTYEAHEALKDSTPKKSLDARVIEGFRQQSLPILAVLDRIIESFIRRNEPVLVEGVHLMSDYLIGKMQELTYSEVPCIPMLIYIVNEGKHKERFATRAKSMTLLPKSNKYVKNFKAIRIIQDFLIDTARDSESGALRVMAVNNTNVDRSVSSIHTFLLSCLEHWSQGTKGFGRLIPQKKSGGSKEAVKNIIQWRIDKQQRAHSVIGAKAKKSEGGNLSAPRRTPSVPPTAQQCVHSDSEGATTASLQGS